MIQLSYQAAFDPYNAAFRLLRLRDEDWSRNPIEFEGAQVADFYMLFPTFASQFRAKKGHVALRARVLAQFRDEVPYARLPEPQTLLQRMKPFQMAAIALLVNAGFADEGQWKGGMLLATAAPLPSTLQKRIDLVNGEQKELKNFVSTLLSAYPVAGPDGLKARSGLLEFRYDVV